MRASSFMVLLLRNADHLWLGTDAENRRDAVAKGRWSSRKGYRAPAGSGDHWRTSPAYTSMLERITAETASASLARLMMLRAIAGVEPGKRVKAKG